MLHRTRSVFALVLIVTFLVTACIPPELGAFVMGCSLVQGHFTLPAPIPMPFSMPVEVQDMDDNVLGSTSIQLITGDTSVTMSIPVSPPQPVGTFLLIVADGAVPLGGAPCTGEAEAAPTFFNPGDGRVAPLPGDRLAIYCDQPPGSLDVWGVDDQSKGFRLATFTFDALAMAGPTGLSATVDPNGIISVSMDEQGNLWAAWNGGVHGADGQPGHGFAKGFRCR